MHNGILVVDKPSDWTSFDVIAKMRGVLKTKKIGHSGTLDPMATGVLPLFIGPAARAVDMQTNHQKAYTAHILLGKKTDTADITGEVLDTCDKVVSEDEFKNILPSLCGEQLQMPPMYSAIKINGQALYKLARKGIEIKREPRKIEIFAIDFVGKVAENEYEINIKCSKGTYIRVLAEDIGTALGTLATMSALRRTQSGAYLIENAMTLEEIYKANESGNIDDFLLPISTVFTDFEKINVTEEQKQRLMNGAASYMKKPDGEYAIYCEKDFLGLATVLENEMTVKKLFVERAGMK